MKWTHRGRLSWSRRLAFVGLAAVTLAPVACGGDDNNNADSSPAAAADSADTMELTVGVGREDFLDSLVVVADEQGFFAEQGLDVEIVTDTSGAKGIAALSSGDVEVITSVWDRMVSAQDEGLDIKAFGLQMMRYPSSIAVKNDVIDDAGITDDQSVTEKIQALAELGDVKVALTNPGSSGEVFFRYVCAQADVDCDAAFDLIPIDDEGGMQVALAQGQVQAIVRTQPYTNIAAAESDASVIVSGLSDMPEFENYVFVYAAAFAETIAEKPEAFVRYLAATDQARQFIEDNPDEARDLILDRTMEAGDPNREAAAEAWPDYTTAIPSDVRITLDVAQGTQDQLGEIQGDEIDFDPSKIVDTDPSDGLAAG